MENEKNDTPDQQPEPIPQSISEIVTPTVASVPSDTSGNLFANTTSIPDFGQDASDTTSRSETVNSVAESVTAAEIIEKRKRGRPRGSGAKPQVIPPETAATADSSQISAATGETTVTEPIARETPRVDYQATATLTVAMGTSTLAMVFGPEWQPEDDNERLQLTVAVAQYMESRQMQDIPPGALLAIVLLTYSAKRFRQPNTREKLRNGWLWLKSKISRKKKQ